jgi:hypothetical protein
MGNTSSQSTSNLSESKSFGHIIDYIATQYILTADFKSLTKLYDEQYCNNLVVLTADIIDKNFNDLEITYLAQRVQNKEVVDIERKDKVVFFDKSNTDKLDVGTKLKKKRICEGIAKFYVKIAHIFAAIVTTINPVYTYKDNEGNKITRPLSQKDQIPVNAKDRTLTKLGLCYQRINSLTYGQDYNKITIDEPINVHPKICNINANKESLQDEPGIPELYSLYLDKYDYKSGHFTDMQESTKRQYAQDLRTFYKVFTGNENDPDTPIKRFSDIKLKDYQQNPGCQGANAPLKRSVSGTLKDKLFKDYALTLQKMVRKSNKVQGDLLSVINDIFIYDIDPKTEKKLIRVNPTLTEEKLQVLVVNTRKTIIDYYVTCETDFTTGVKLYEAIVETQIRMTTESQLKELDNVSRELIHSIEPTTPPPSSP